MQQNVIVKMPRLPDGLTPARAMDLLPQLLGSFAKEKMALDILAGVDGVAHARDIGLFSLLLAQTYPVPVAFLVLDRVPGESLWDWVRNNPLLKAPKFFEVAKSLAALLLGVHRFMIVHGDLWPKNIIMTPQGQPVLIDLGQAAFRDLYLAYDVRAIGASHPYLAPEKHGSVEADIYSLGAVFYFLATKENPPNHFPKDMDDIKLTVLKDVRTLNRSLYDENCGIIDIISRCLRQPADRTPHAQAVLQDLDLFATSF